MCPKTTLAGADDGTLRRWGPDDGAMLGAHTHGEGVTCLHIAGGVLFAGDGPSSTRILGSFQVPSQTRMRHSAC